MKYLLMLSFLAFSLLLYNLVDAQDIKMKTKAGKIKLKETTGNSTLNKNISAAKDVTASKSLHLNLNNLFTFSFYGILQNI